MIEVEDFLECPHCGEETFFSGTIGLGAISFGDDVPIDDNCSKCDNVIKVNVCFYFELVVRNGK